MKTLLKPLQTISFSKLIKDIDVLNNEKLEQNLQYLYEILQTKNDYLKSYLKISNYIMPSLISSVNYNFLCNIDWEVVVEKSDLISLVRFSSSATLFMFSYLLFLF